MKHIPGSAPAARGWRAAAAFAARQASLGLAHVLIGPDSVPMPRWRSPRQRRLAYAGLALATLVLAIINIASLLPAAGPHAPQAGHPWDLLARDAVAIAAVAPLPLAARYPLLGWRIGWVALLLVPALRATWWGGWPWGPAQVLALFVAYCLAGVRLERPALWWMWGLSLIPLWLWLPARIANLNGPVGATVAFTAATVAVDSIGLRWRTQQALAAQTERVEEERASRTVLEERARIARELHDVVAHHMSLIAVQAETAPFRLGDLPESARAEFGSMSAAARLALSDMRRLLGVLRQDEPVQLAPHPALADLPALVEAARRAGVTVELSAPGALDAVPSGVGVCAYRIVQESLSNASQHAPGAPVSVTVDQDSLAVTLRVANGPCGRARRTGNERGSGHGLAGMRERVALLGGSLSAGPSPDGGFAVHAVLPLGDAS